MSKRPPKLRRYRPSFIRVIDGGRAEPQFKRPRQKSAKSNAVSVALTENNAGEVVLTVAIDASPTGYGCRAQMFVVEQEQGADLIAALKKLVKQ